MYCEIVEPQCVDAASQPSHHSLLCIRLLSQFKVCVAFIPDRRRREVFAEDGMYTVYSKEIERCVASVRR